LTSASTTTESKPAAVRELLSRKTSFGLVPVLAVFIIAIGLRFAGITFDSMWLDEGYQTMVDATGVKPRDLDILKPEPFLFSLGAPRSPEGVLSNFRQVDPLCPPLYFLLLNRWMSIFGTADLAVRSLSALTSGLALLSIYFGAKKILGARPAFFALLLGAVSPFDITYAQEARMYSLVMLTSSLSCLSFFLLSRETEKQERSSKRACLGLTLAYGVSTWALINTHYTALYVVAFQGLYGLFVSARRKSIVPLLYFSTGWLIALLLWLPWLDMFRQSASGRSNYYVNRDSGILWSFKGLMRMPINWINFLSGGRIVAYAAPIYATAGALLLTGLGLAFKGNSNNRFSAILTRVMPSKLKTTLASENQANRDALSFFLLWALVPALVALSIDIIECRKTVEVTRYLMGTAPAVLILAGAGASALFQGFTSLRFIVIAHICFALINYTYAHVTPQREPWRDLARIIEEKVPTSELLLISPHYDMVCLNRYLTRPRMQVGTGPLLGNQQVTAVLRGRDRFHLVCAQEGASMKVFIPARFSLIDTVELKHGLELTSWQAADGH
jgi:hypothetical protein